MTPISAPAASGRRLVSSGEGLGLEYYSLIGFRV